MKRSPEPDRRREARRPQEPPEREPEPVAAELLALQRSAGNRAVAAMLARDAKAPPKPKDKDKAPPARAAGPRITIAGVGEIPLESFQWGTHRGAGGDQQQQVTEMVLTSKVGPHSTDLWRSMSHGEAHDAEIVYPSKDGELRITLKGAIVSSYTLSGDGEDALEGWSLNFTGVEFHTPKDGKDMQGDVRGWDLDERRPG